MRKVSGAAAAATRVVAAIRQAAAPAAAAVHAAAAVAAAAGIIAGELAILLPEWAELIFGVPAIMVVFGAVLWTKGFGPEDRELFRMSKRDIAELSLPDPSTGGDAPR